MPIILNGTTGITTPGITNTGPFTFQGVVELPAGAVGAPSLTTTGDTNTGIYFPAANQIAIATDGAQRVLVDAAGNVGVGVAPQAWNSAFKVVEIGTKGNAVFSHTSNYNVNLSSNAYYDSVGYKYGNTAPASYYNQYNGIHSWYTAASGTAGTAISFTQAMTLDASSNLFVGLTGTAFGKINTTSLAVYEGNNAADGGVYIYRKSSSPRLGAISSFGSDSGLIFETNAGGVTSERMRLDSVGNLGIGTTSPASFGKVTIQVTGTTTPTNVTNVGPSSINLYAATSGSSTDGTTGIFGWNATTGIASGIGFVRENSTNWGTQIRFYTHPTPTTNIGDITERARIDASGRFLVSSFNAQPRFYAERSGDQTGYNSTSQGDVVVVYNSAVQNIGSHYSTTTGKFTAPVTGMYIFQASVYSLSGTAFDQAWLVVNGARQAGTDVVYTLSPSSIVCGTWMIYLTANDTVGFHPYNPTNTNQTITANANHTWFKGYLIG